MKPRSLRGTTTAPPLVTAPTVGATFLVLGPLYALAFSRWGSYVGIPGANLFIPDAMVAVGAILFVWRGQRPRRSSLQRPTDTFSGWLLFLAIVYVVLWISQAEQAPLLILRDVAPFGYLAVLPLIARAILEVGLPTVGRWLRRACWYHLAWGLPAALGLLPPLQILPSTIAGQKFFELRDDVDASIFVASVLVAAIGLGGDHPSKISNALLLAGSLTAIVLQSSRTGLISLTLASLVATAIVRPWHRDAGRFGIRAIGLVLAAWVTVVTALTFPTVIPDTGVLARVGLGTSQESSRLAEGASNTADARWQAWALLLDYTSKTPGGTAFGTGPGSDAVASSGALAHLSGDPSVRAPHSWPVGLYARFGLIGVVLWSSALWALTRRRYPIAEHRRPPPAVVAQSLAAWSGLGLSLGIAATVGVVVESNFGALPLSLACAGISACRSLREDA